MQSADFNASEIAGSYCDYYEPRGSGAHERSDDRVCVYGYRLPRSEAEPERVTAVLQRLHRAA